jgi:hypothetical protein
MRSSKLLLLATSFALAACASASQGSGASSGSASADENSITSDQITQANVPTAFEAVDRLHRAWFLDQALTPNDSATVYLSTNEKLGDGTPSSLRQIPADDVKLIEYLKGTDATMRFGQDAKGGAIIVTRK